MIKSTISVKHSLIFLLFLIEKGRSQINLGSFFLHPQNGGGFDMGMGQGANILGFGGDRSFNLAGNNAGFAMGSNNGALVGGQRVGVDGGVGGGREGVEMGSQVQFGNQPNTMHPAGQLGSFLDNVKNFFSMLGQGMPHQGMPPPPSPPFSLGITTPAPPGNTEGRGEKHIPRPWFPEGEEEKSVPEEKETTKEQIGPKSGEVEIINTETSEEKEPEKEEEEDLLAKSVEFSVDKEPANEFSEDLFTAPTSRPRQLPGLVEFS